MTTEEAKARGLLPADYVDPKAPKPIPTGKGIIEQIEEADKKAKYEPLSIKRLNEIIGIYFPKEE